jgi:hypothetical protein
MYACPIGFFKDGDGAPDVTFPTTLPSLVVISVPSLAGGPSTIKPALFDLTPYSISFLILSYPRNPPYSFLLFDIVHPSTASIGEMSSLSS